MMNPKVNYSKLISVQPPETSRVSSSIFPTNASDVTTKNTNVIDFNFPAVSYADMNSAYLKFKAQIKTDAGASITMANTAGDHLITAFDGGALGLISSVCLFNSENQIVSYVNDFPSYAIARLKERGIEYAETAKNLFGWSETYHEDFLAEQVNPTGGVADPSQFTYGVELAKKAIGTRQYGVETPGQLPGVMTYLGNAATVDLVAETGREVEFAIPAFLFSGLFEGLYLPLAYMGSKSNALRLQIRTSTSEKALVVTCANYVGGVYTYNNKKTRVDAFAAAAKPYVQIKSPEFVLDYVTVDAATDARVKDAIYSGGGIRLMFTDYSTIEDTAMQSGLLTHNSNQTRTAMSLKNITVQLRKNIADSYAYPNITGTGRFSLNSFQFKVGAKYWPNSPLLLDSAEFNGAAYAELVKRSGSMAKGNNSGYVSKFHDEKHCGFELSFDFDNKRVSDSSFDNNTLGLNGLSLANGSNSIVGLFRRSSGTDALKITMIFATDNVLVLENNRATVLESRA